MKTRKKNGKKNIAVLLMLIMAFSMAVPISSVASAEGLDDVYILNSTEDGEIIVEDTDSGADETLFTYDPQPETLIDVQAVIDAYDVAYQTALADGGYLIALGVQKPRWELEWADVGCRYSKRRCHRNTQQHNPRRGSGNRQRPSLPGGRF